MFTYQGRLGQSGAALNGTFDFQFSLWDADTAGNAVGATQTITGVSVSKGHFVVGLDFGAGAFNGSNRWLQVAVRAPATESSFTVLTPRQALTATPYAMRAANAGALTAPLTASNVIQNGTLVGSNALTTFTVSDSAFDASAWYKIAAGSMAGASNVNRFAYRAALARIAARQTLTVMFYANGWVLDGLLDSVFWNLTNNLPVAGYSGINRFGGLGPQNWQGGAAQVNGFTGTSDPYWLTIYQQLPGVGDSVDFINNGLSTGQLFDTYQLDYVTAPDGGTFKVQTNMNGGAWTDLAGCTAVSSVSPTTNGAFLRWRSPAPANTGVRVISTGPGINRILYVDAANSTVTNGLVIEVLGHQGEDFAFYNTFPPNLQGPLLQAWNPDLILMPVWGMSPDAPNFLTLYSSVFQPYVPNAGIVICGQWPRSNFDEANGSAADRPALRQACRQIGASYFDAYVPFGSYAEMQARGFISGDGTHLSLAGYTAYGQLLFQWLGLFEGTVDSPLLNIGTADFVLNTCYTNGPQRGQISACLALNSTAGNAAKVGLFLDQGASGSWTQTGLAVQRGAGAALADIYQLGANIQPGARFVFTNLGTGDASAAVVPGSCQWTKF